MKNIFIFLIVLSALLNDKTFAADYYWVGGSGNWSDLNHWATSSGGSSFYSVVPGPDDNVFFDANSFTESGSVLSLTTGTISCKNMDWSGVTDTPSLEGATTITLLIYGSLTLNEAMQFNFDGTVQFSSSSPGNTISTKEFELKECIFDGIGGEWTLLDSLSVTKDIELINGTLNTNSQSVACVRFNSDYTNNRTLNLGGSNIIIDGSLYSTAWNVNTTNFNLNASTSIIYFFNESVMKNSGTGSINFNNVVFKDTINQSIGTVENSKDSPDITFNKLSMYSGGKIIGEYQYDTLFLNAGYSYEFESNKTQTIEETILTNANCSEGILILESSADDTPANFSKASGSITLENTLLNNVNAIGGATFVANNSIGLGNNSGWLINLAATRDLYWVGGTGLWDDQNHWALSSGGIGGACIPTAIDNVFFDENSFTGVGDSVIINESNATCNDMNWNNASNVPFLYNESVPELRIYGSLNLIADMNYQYAGEVFFNSYNINNTISSKNHPFLNNVYIDGSNGGWTLIDSLNIPAHTLTFNTGKLTTNDQTIVCDDFLSEDTCNRSLILGNSDIYVVGSSLYSVKINTNNLSLIADNSTFYVRKGFATIGGGIEFNNLVFNDSTLDAYIGPVISTIPTDTNVFNKIEFTGNGEISGDNKIDTLLMSPGYDYLFRFNRTQVINDYWSAEGSCNKVISILSDNNGSQAFIDKTASNTELSYIVARDIGATGNTALTANNSVDLGNNTGWTFSEAEGVDLYWVGGTGDWSDANHWSLTSGGMGGACIPTANDNVFFDVNSFPTSIDTVTISGNAYCKDMVWTEDADSSYLESEFNHDLHIHGSLTLSSKVDFQSQGSIYFQANDSGKTIATAGNLLQCRSIYFEGAGEWILQDSLITYSIISLKNGALITNDFNVSSRGFYSIGTSNSRYLRLGDSKIRISFGFWSVNHNNLDFDAGSSEIIFTSGGTFNLSGGSNVTYNKVSFPNKSPFGTTNRLSTSPLYKNPESSGVLIKSLTANADVYFEEAFIFDSLVLYAGNTYTFEADFTQVINDYLGLLGNGCFPINLKSSVTGQQAFIQSDSGSVNGNFLVIQDIGATGDADFFAGDQSTDVSNNTGWVFENQPGFIFGFPDTTYLCPNQEEILLTTENFNGGETFLWSDLSTESTLLVDTIGTYWVTVNYDSNCSITDTTKIVEAESFDVTILGSQDSLLCFKDSIMLYTTTNTPISSYVWQDDSTQDSLLASEPGLYWVEVTANSGCKQRDSLELFAAPNIKIQHGEVPSLCEGDTLTLFLFIQDTSTTYLWQDSTTLPTLNVTEQGTYWVTVSLNQCNQTDSITINFNPLPNINLGNDTILCDGDSLLLNATDTNTNYLWQDGSTNQTYTIYEEGTYWVEAATESCNTTDTINVTYNDLPSVYLGSDTSLCDGDSLILDVANDTVSYLWVNGSNESLFLVVKEGTYWVEVTANSCTNRDSIVVTYNTFPIVNLGKDSTLCEGDTLKLDVTTVNATYLWQDNSTLPNFSVVQEGTYWVSVNSNECITSDTIQVIYNPLPIVNLQPDTTICDGDTLKLDVTTADATYLWQNNTTSPTILISQEGKYWVKVTLENCSVTDTTNINFTALPTIDLGNDQILCDGDSLVLDITADNSDYLWQDSSSNSTYTITQTGSYWAQLTTKNCNNSDSINVTFNPIPPIDLGKDTILCPNSEMVLDATVPGANYQWQDQSVASFFNIYEEGAYWVQLTLDGCTNSDTIEVDYETAVDLGDDILLCTGEQRMLDASLPSASYNWQNNSNNATLNVKDEGTYWVEATTDYCITRDTIVVDKIVFDMPNVFTPNDDGDNDNFIPIQTNNIQEAVLTIHNRYGQQLFETYNLLDGWDGKANGKDVSHGIYYWIAEYQDVNGKVCQSQGPITLIR